MGREPLYMVEINSVSKSFGSISAVKDFSLKISEGEVHGILGPTASGKTTLLKMIVGLLKPDRGYIRIQGINVQDESIRVKRIIGYMPESPQLYEFLTGAEYLDFIADIYGLESEVKLRRIKELLRAFKLEDRKDEWITNYSHGMKQKIALIAALLHRPRLLVLDEPLVGFDPDGARIFKDLIRRLAKRGVTTVFSTHILEIAEAICDRVTIMHKGQKLLEGTVAKFRETAEMPGSSLEDVFLKLTGSTELSEVIEALK